MMIDPNTTVRRLLGAIPSCTIVFEEFNIQTSGSEEKTLESVCTAHGISVDEFLQAVEDLDWDQDFENSPTARRPR
jgi:hypothetical protein